jgi:predicted ATP-grasp superfamily ATP-dependent carboligase
MTPFRRYFWECVDCPLAKGVEFVKALAEPVALGKAIPGIQSGSVQWVRLTWGNFAVRLPRRDVISIIRQGRVGMSSIERAMGHPAWDAVGLLVVGGSVRAAVQAVARGWGRGPGSGAGVVPLAVDRFADVDTGLCGPVLATGNVSDGSGARPGWLRSVEEVLSQQPELPILPVGGCENLPEELAVWRTRTQVAFASEVAVNRVRDPDWVAGVLREAGSPALGVANRGNFPSESEGSLGTWLVKPIRGAGGQGIRAWRPSEVISSDGYLQEYREGEPVSAAYVATEAGVELIGLTRQLIGLAYGTGRFGYAGNILWDRTEEAIERNVREQARRVGECLGEESGLRGVFGIDGVLDAAGQWWVVEVNPRYTAAMELWERGGRPVLMEHLAATLGGMWARRDGTPKQVLPDSRAAGLVMGKRIVYAERCGRAVGLAQLAAAGDTQWRPEWVADLPADGQLFSPGEPVCTVFAEEATDAACRAALANRARRVLTEHLLPE